MGKSYIVHSHSPRGTSSSSFSSPPRVRARVGKLPPPSQTIERELRESLRTGCESRAACYDLSDHCKCTYSQRNRRPRMRSPYSSELLQYDDFRLVSRRRVVPAFWGCTWCQSLLPAILSFNQASGRPISVTRLISHSPACLSYVGAVCHDRSSPSTHHLLILLSVPLPPPRQPS